MNKVMLMGRLCFEPEISVISDGTEKTSNRLAVQRDYGKKDEKKTDFINIVAWRKTAAFLCNYFQKGDGILIEGSIQVNSYTDKEGQNRDFTVVVVDKAHFPLDRKNTAQSAPAVQAPPNNTEFTEIPADDLPF
jgi:single-strand DNA-binding protein